MHYDSPRSASPKHQVVDDKHAWAHWEYSPEEWAVFDRVDWQAAWLRYWLPNLLPPVCFFLLFLLGVFVFHIPVLGLVLMMLPFLLPIVLVMFIVRAYAYHEAKTRHQARQNRDHQNRVTFAKDAVWEAGTYFPLWFLLGVRMTSQPAVLHFRRKHHVVAEQGSSNRYETLRVLVPRGHEEEATQLMERFRTEVIEAKKPAYSPPEPV